MDVYRAGQVFVLHVRNVVGVPELLCETKIDDVDLIAMFANSYEESCRA